MGDASAKYAKAAKRAAQGGRQEDRPQGDQLPALEQKALQKLRTEAKEHGATLQTGGKGGLPPSFVLGVMRRDKFKCVNDGCGSQKDLTVHHKGGIVDSPKAAKAGHRLTRDNVETLCADCHNKLHEEAREEGTDSSQVLPIGDKGTDRDHGDKPVSDGN